MKQFVGEVSSEERDYIRRLNSQKTALEELFLILDSESDLLKDAKEEHSKVLAKYNDWWQKTSLKYNWEKVPGSFWTIDFDSKRVYIDI